MRIDAAFPSKYLKAADLQGRTVTVNVAKIEIEEVGDDERPVVYFQGAKKGFVLNKTNMNTVAEAYGFETDDWIGRPISLFEAMVDYQGKSTPSIRVKVPKQQAMANSQAPLHQVPPRQRVADQANNQFNDEIPF